MLESVFKPRSLCSQNSESYVLHPAVSLYWFCLRGSLSPFSYSDPEGLNMLTFSCLSQHCEMRCLPNTQKRLNACCWLDHMTVREEGVVPLYPLTLPRPAPTPVRGAQSSYLPTVGHVVSLICGALSKWE